MWSGLAQLQSLMFAGAVLLAAFFFTVGGIFMKLSDGLTRFWPTVIVFALFVTGAALQTVAMKRSDLVFTYLAVVASNPCSRFSSESSCSARVARRCASPEWY